MGITIKFRDYFRNNLKDKLAIRSKRPKGRVCIFDKTDDESLDQIEDTSNLIVYQGREILLQRAFNQAMIGYGAATPTHYISWFGLGIGGAGANLLIPLVPKLKDTELIQPAIISATDPTVVNGGRLHPFDNVEYIIDPSNENKRLIAQITVSISKTDANGPTGGTDPSDYYDLNEAGLYVSNSNDPISFNPATAKLFARVTFSTIRKWYARSLVFVWYIYF